MAETLSEALVRRRAEDIDDQAFDGFIAQPGARAALDDAFGGQFGSADRELQKGMVVVAHERAMANRAARQGASAPTPAGAGAEASGPPRYTEEQVVAKGRGLDDAAFDKTVAQPQAIAALDQAFGGKFSQAPREIQKGLLVIFAEAQAAAQAQAQAGPPPELPDAAFEAFVADAARKEMLEKIAQGAMQTSFDALPREQQKQIVTMVLVRAQQQNGGPGPQQA